MIRPISIYSRLTDEKSQSTPSREIRLKQARWVTPILCFTQAEVKIPRNHIDGVYIVEKIDLIQILEDLEKRL